MPSLVRVGSELVRLKERRGAPGVAVDELDFTEEDTGARDDAKYYRYEFGNWRYVLAKPRNRLPPFLGHTQIFHSVLDVCDRIKAVVEALEPGVHDFYPLELLLPDGTPWPEPYWLWRVSRAVAGVIVELSPQNKWGEFSGDFAAENPDAPPPLSITAPRPNDVLDADAVAGLHAWTEKYDPYEQVYFSDALVDALKLGKLAPESCFSFSPLEVAKRPAASVAELERRVRLNEPRQSRIRAHRKARLAARTVALDAKSSLLSDTCGA